MKGRVLASVFAGLLLELPCAAIAADGTDLSATNQEHAIWARVDDSVDSAARLKTVLARHSDPTDPTSGWSLRQTLGHSTSAVHAGDGIPVHAAAAGTVVEIKRTKDSGLYVLIRHSDLLESGYSHLLSIAPGIKVGSEIEAGAVIGTVKTTGE